VLIDGLASVLITEYYEDTKPALYIYKEGYPNYPSPLLYIWPAFRPKDIGRTRAQSIFSFGFSRRVPRGYEASSLYS
jgi:hypothetical protein